VTEENGAAGEGDGQTNDRDGEHNQEGLYQDAESFFYT
jgi:hypothetical protein